MRQVYNKLLSLPHGDLVSKLFITGEATKVVWLECWYVPEYEEWCVDILANDGTAPNFPNGYKYGASL